jgi:hypothetical protein
MVDEHIEIQPADPRARRRVLTFVIVAALAGLWGIVEIEDWLNRLQQPGADLQHSAEQVARLLGTMDAVISIALAGLGLVVARLSLRVLRAERFPPPGSHVIVDTRVIVGAGARRRAYIGFVMAAGLAALGVILPYLLWHALHVLTTIASPT